MTPSQLLSWFLVLFSFMIHCRFVHGEEGGSPPIFPTAQNITGQLGRLESRQVDMTQEISFQYAVHKEYENFVIETRAGNRTTIEHPITFEVRQQRFSESWQLPLETSLGYVYRTANKTICINEHLPSYLINSNDHLGSSGRSRQRNATGNIVTVTVSTLSPSPISFALLVRNVCHLVPLNESRQVQVTTTSPQLMHFHFLPKDESKSGAVIVRLFSNDTRCMTVSIQEPKCPFHGDENSVAYEGYRHTMTHRGAVTVRRDRYPHGFFLVLVLHSRDKICMGSDADDSGEDEETRVKTVNLIVEESISDTDFYNGWFWPLIWCIVGVGVTSVLSVILCLWRNQNVGKEDGIVSKTEGRGNTTPSPPLQVTSFQTYPNPVNSSNSNVEIIEPEPSPRPRPKVTLNQLTNKPYERLEKRNKLFVLTVLIVACYYTLPAIQLVTMHLRISHSTGNLDMCYYNFECAYPLGWINDFNHLYSNIGYLASGISALIFLKGLQCYHTSYRKEGHGIPPHFGISYALACAILFEGVLSASYHVCPNRSNFHHDTCFMYVAATLTALKMYQARHPDTNIGAPTAFLILGVLMLLDLIGELWESTWYFLIFTFIHAAAFFTLATKMVFLGSPAKFSWKVSQKIWSKKGVESEDEKPIAGRDVLGLIVVGFVLNAYLCVHYGNFCEPISDFGTYILKILIGNVGLYFVYYVTMKFFYEVKESWNTSSSILTFLDKVKYFDFCCLLVIVSGVLWGFGASHFADPKSAWEKTPAISRTFNEPCTFFDSHDLWHLFSGPALFTTLLALKFIDLDLLNETHEKIAVF